MANEQSHIKDMASLIFDDKNFNKHTAQGMQMLEQSIQRNGFGRSVVCDKNNVLIGGNGVVETATRLGKCKVRVVETDGEELVVVKRTDIDINTKKGRELAAADNATAAVDLNWDEEALRSVQEELDIDFEDWGLDLPPLDGDEGNSNTPSSNEKNSNAFSSSLGGLADPSTAAESTHPLEHKASMGDLWELGGHRVLCEDYASESNLNRLMDGKLASMLLTAEIMSSSVIIENLSNKLEAGSPLYMWTAPDCLSMSLLHSAEAGIMFSSLLVWVKSDAHFGRKDYASKHELCVYGWKPGAPRRWYGDNKATDVLTYPSLPLGTSPLFSLPIELSEYLIDNSSQKADIILDPLGGGSTLVAAHKTGRRAYMLTPNMESLDTLIAIYRNFCSGSDEDIFLIKKDGTKVPYSEVELKKR